MAEIGNDFNVDECTIRRHFSACWKQSPKPRIAHRPRVLVVDGTGVTKRECILLVSVDGSSGIPVSWMPTARECFASWQQFFASMEKNGISPETIVCDGQKGLLKAILATWPQTKVQRCTFHVIRQASLWLTQNPKTDAGRELRNIVLKISSIHLDHERKTWLTAFEKWCHEYNAFLKERTCVHGTKKWWYTHRKLRAVRSLLANAIPDLFRYVDDPSIPNTSS